MKKVLNVNNNVRLYVKINKTITCVISLLSSPSHTEQICNIAIEKLMYALKNKYIVMMAENEKLHYRYLLF